jgi:hypothetical protein
MKNRFNKVDAILTTIKVVEDNPFMDLEDIVDKVKKELYNEFNATKATITFINYNMRAIIHTTINTPKRLPITPEWAKEWKSHVEKGFRIEESKKRDKKLEDLGI